MATPFRCLSRRGATHSRGACWSLSWSPSSPRPSCHGAHSLHAAQRPCSFPHKRLSSHGSTSDGKPRAIPGSPGVALNAAQPPALAPGQRPSLAPMGPTLAATPADAAASPQPAPASSAAALSPRLLSLAGLQASDFRHPLDEQNTSFLRALPGLELVAKGVLGPVAEQVLVLENIATAIKVGPDQMPSVHALLQEAAQILQMQAPDLYVRQNPAPNAYTLAIAGRTPFIVVHTALLELLTPAELQAVLAHELGHLKCDHGLWLTVANVLATGTVSLLPVVSGAVEDTLLRWLRAAELTCDRAALLVAQQPRVVIGALMKLAGGCASYAHELNVDAFLQQARSYDEATSSMLGWYLRNAQTRALSHPLPVMRAREIDRWASSTQYQALLVRSGGRGGGPGAWAAGGTARAPGGAPGPGGEARPGAGPGAPAASSMATVE